MKLPYKAATLLYVFNAADQVLLLERARHPNQGLWSPPGGKLKMEIGESPYGCACREAGEEMGLNLSPADIHLSGMVSEAGYQEETHWLMFLFEIRLKLTHAPPVHAEGRFAFFNRKDLESLRIPDTDRDKIWPWFWQYRGGFFAAHCQCRADGGHLWSLHEARGADGVASRSFVGVAHE